MVTEKITVEIYEGSSVEVLILEQILDEFL